jgi:uncharacterized protein (TIGR03435 family)
MREISDMELLQDYARHGSEAAFAELVQRHINLVYSAALRHVGIPAQAEETTQAVFVILARKAASLRPGTILEAWLHQTTRLTALSLMRAERRRQFREQEVYMQSTLQEHNADAVWAQLAPLLDEGLARLGQTDREALMLRFFKDKSVREVAAALKVTEPAAQRRVLRAVEKLRSFFNKRGVIVPAAVIMAAISAHSVQAAPITLAKSVTAMAITKGATSSASTLTLIKGALKIMAWTKAKTVIVIGAGVLLTAGVTTVAVEHLSQHAAEPWQLAELDYKLLITPPYKTEVLPTAYEQRSPLNNTTGTTSEVGGRAVGINVSLREILYLAYVTQGPVAPYRMVLNTALPAGRYDFIANQPNASQAALRQEIKNKFGLTARFETIETNVLLLKVKYPKLAGMKRTPGSANQHFSSSTLVSAADLNMADLANYLENGFLKLPVIDQTGLTDQYDYLLAWDPTRNDSLKRALSDQLGLELVPDTARVEMLIVDKAR